jgi:hypothetical protein
MEYTYDDKKLTITVDEETRGFLQDLIEANGGEANLRCEYDALESLVCNSDLEWIQPHEIGALTDAPILGIVERDDHGTITRVIHAWGFEPYALRSFVSDLIDDGKATFVSSF